MGEIFHAGSQCSIWNFLPTSSKPPSPPPTPIAHARSHSHAQPAPIQFYRSLASVPASKWVGGEQGLGGCPGAGGGAHRNALDRLVAGSGVGSGSGVGPGQVGEEPGCILGGLVVRRRGHLLNVEGLAVR